MDLVRVPKIERWLWFQIMHLHMLLALPKLLSLVVFQPQNWATLRYNNIYQNSMQKEIFAVDFVTIWWCYLEGLKEGGAQYQTGYHVELWSMEGVGCTNSQGLLEDGVYITCNMECWFCPIWWKEEEYYVRRLRWTWCSNFKVTIGWWWNVNRDLYLDERARDY